MPRAFNVLIGTTQSYFLMINFVKINFFITCSEGNAIARFLLVTLISSNPAINNTLGLLWC